MIIEIILQIILRRRLMLQSAAQWVTNMTSTPAAHLKCITFPSPPFPEEKSQREQEQRIMIHGSWLIKLHVVSSSENIYVWQAEQSVSEQNISNFTFNCKLNFISWWYSISRWVYQPQSIFIVRCRLHRIACPSTLSIDANLLVRRVTSIRPSLSQSMTWNAKQDLVASIFLLT